ncbi:MAG TPA: phospholipid carrier-dependent glycosyltransferase [Patescibacteria group bacterium]|nr:phospholipid carrier-dependent glycosyltransferase [Patescibacteria group bacterium]
MDTHSQNMAGMNSGESIGLPASGRKENPWVWACLGFLLVAYGFSVIRVGAVGLFGRYQDDSIYFSAAKALASGQGYVLPSFPVPLKATKYPELYPAVLAGIWKIDPHFPNNVRLAAALTLAFGFAALLFAFLLLRRWPGMGDWPALLAIALVALTSHFVVLSASVLSDVPFMAFLLAAVYLAETSLSGKQGRVALAIGAGVLSGFCVGLRSLGVAAVAGIGLAFLLKRQYRRLAWFSLAVLPLALFFLWPALTAALHPSGAGPAVGPGDSGWTQTLCYYSSYACNWRMNVTNFPTLVSVMKVNLLFTSVQPGAFLALPLTAGAGLSGVVLLWLLSFIVWIGVLRHCKALFPEPFVLTFLFMLVLILPWPYPVGRFLLPFLPLFFGGLVIEARKFASLVTNSLRYRRALREQVLAGLLGLGGLALGGTIAVNYLWSIPSWNARLGTELAGLLADRRGAYEWLRRNAAPDAKVIAYEDGPVYLYTGRESIRPIECLTQVYYLGRRGFAERDAARLFDVADHIGASYWLVTPDDFAMAEPLDRNLLLRKERELLAMAPVVFKSADGAVRVYDVRSLTRADERGRSKPAAQPSPGA